MSKLGRRYSTARVSKRLTYFNGRLLTRAVLFLFIASVAPLLQSLNGLIETLAR